MKPNTAYNIFSTSIYVIGVSAHLWTVYIAFTHGGFIKGVLSLFFPFLSEIYWVFKMFGVNTFYSISMIVVTILIIVTSPALNSR